MAVNCLCIHVLVISIFRVQLRLHSMRKLHPLQTVPPAYCSSSQIRQETHPENRDGMCKPEIMALFNGFLQPPTEYKNTDRHVPKVVEENLEEYYNLHYEDVVGGIATRYKYVQVTPVDMGLSVDDVLNL